MIWPIKAIGTVAVLSGTLLAGATMADHMGPDHGGPPGMIFGHPLVRLILGQRGRRMVLASELNLTPMQHEKIRAILETHRDEIDQVAKELVSAGRDLRGTILAAKTDDAAIHQAAGGLSKDIGDAALLLAHIRGEVAPLLTPEQLQAVATFRTDSDKAVDQFLEDLAKPEPAGPATPPPPPADDQP